MDLILFKSLMFHHLPRQYLGIFIADLDQEHINTVKWPEPKSIGFITRQPDHCATYPYTCSSREKLVGEATVHNDNVGTKNEGWC